MNFGHRVTNQHGKLILEAETFHACTGIDEKPKRMPEELAEKLKPLPAADLNPLDAVIVMASDSVSDNDEDHD